MVVGIFRSEDKIVVGSECAGWFPTHGSSPAESEMKCWSVVSIASDSGECREATRFPEESAMSWSSVKRCDDLPGYLVRGQFSPNEKGALLYD